MGNQREQELYDKMAPLLSKARQDLSQITTDRLVARSGCRLEANGELRLTFFGRDYMIAPPQFTVRSGDTGEEPSSFVQAILLTYLVTADGTTPSAHLVAFRGLPEGMFYAVAFRDFADNRLTKALDKVGEEAFHRAAAQLGGQPLDIGSTGYVFDALPRLKVAAVYWMGDEELPSRASILFEDTAPHYMPTEGLAILGKQLVAMLINLSD